MQDNSTPVSKDVYSLVTNKIIELLEAGTIPWRKPWTDAGLPRNLISQRPYRGINLMLLNALDYGENLFLTWKQLKTIGASVNKGEQGNIVVFNKMIEHQVEKNGEIKVEKKSLLRYYKVFNVAQCKDIPAAFLPKENNDLAPLVECAVIVEGMKDMPKIVHKKAEAFYSPSEDFINMPKMKTFTSSEEYYGTLFHELVHSTGHEKRLGRKEVFQNPEFETEMYSMEELVAEIGSCYLKSYCGIHIAGLDNSAAYIRNWLEILKGDTRFIVIASAKAQQAVEYILKVPDAKEESEQLVLEIEK